MNRLTRMVLAAGMMLAASPGARAGDPVGELPYTPLDLHPADMSFSSGAKIGSAGPIPGIVRQGTTAMPDPRQIEMPTVVTPSLPGVSDPENLIGRAGTGFFIGEDGALLTAAHVVKDCTRMQVISKYVTRTWVSLIAADEDNDIAILKGNGLRAPAVARIAAKPPVSDKLFVLGFPASSGLTTATETWGVVQNQKFPANMGPLTNPRELLWMAAPAITHGYSGGPIFDPKLGAVVGMVKGEVEAGYLRLVHDMPTAGVAIGPGVSPIAELVRHERSYAAVSLTSSPGEAGQDSLRRATVHVLCWR